MTFARKKSSGSLSARTARVGKPAKRWGRWGSYLAALGMSVATAAAAQDPPPAIAPQLQLVDRLPARRATPPGEASKTAYLLVYFKEHAHSLFFAVSKDGYRFTDVHDGQPVLSGRDVAEQKGIRDPYLMRGPDGAFYLTMTDLHIFAKQEGLRDTPWQRPEQDYGWGNNRSIILMKSRDLIHWTHARVDVTRLFPAYREAGVAWAPEAIYDPRARKIMVYYTSRIGKGVHSIVYSYADPAFRTLTTEPKPLFAVPRAGKNAVDADITRIGDRYHMFFSTDDGGGHLRQATSARLTGGYVYDPTKVDPEAVDTEAPMLWRRHGTGTYVLMYDVFGARPNNMGFSETTDFRTFRNIGRFNDPGSPMTTTNFTSPKHGSVTAITPAEADRLLDYFKAR